MVMYLPFFSFVYINEFNDFYFLLKTKFRFFQHHLIQQIPYQLIQLSLVEDEIDWMSETKYENNFQSAYSAWYFVSTSSKLFEICFAPNLFCAKRKNNSRTPLISIFGLYIWSINSFWKTSSTRFQTCTTPLSGVFLFFNCSNQLIYQNFSKSNPIN